MTRNKDSLLEIDRMNNQKGLQDQGMHMRLRRAVKAVAYLLNSLVFPVALVFGFAGSQADYSPAEQAAAIWWAAGFACVGLVNILAMSRPPRNLLIPLHTMAYLLNAVVMVCGGWFWLVAMNSYVHGQRYPPIESIGLWVLASTSMVALLLGNSFPEK
jgi:hypothetical protein